MPSGSAMFLADEATGALRPLGSVRRTSSPTSQPWVIDW